MMTGNQTAEGVGTPAPAGTAPEQAIKELVVCSSPLPPCRGEGWVLVEERDGCSIWEREAPCGRTAPNA